MRNILRIADKMFVVHCILLGQSLLFAHASERDRDTSYESAEVDIKTGIVHGIQNYPPDVEFAVIAVKTDLRSLFKTARSQMPYFSSFGLRLASPVITGFASTNNLDELLFIYDSEGQNREVWGWRPISSAIGPAPYDGDAEYCDGRMRLEFLNKVSSPKAERFRNITVVLEGEKKQVTFESVIQDFHIDKAKFSRVFANQVYMRCPCGPFGVEDGVARNIQAHDAAGVKPSVPRVPGGGSLVSLNAREISEVVYWLWRRKGKTDEYAGFVKAHPELFEPIAGEEEFRTELGRRLIGTWK